LCLKKTLDKTFFIAYNYLSSHGRLGGNYDEKTNITQCASFLVIEMRLSNIVSVDIKKAMERAQIFALNFTREVPLDAENGVL